mmetsp:Transcript_11373/g.23981  ORF Transcript_11373/g.23981 Transcript_11373/m.23981 type:complete len:546 (+) Transcript_11373:103-1740(+)|eukprot:CAMPEP_0178626938 /NCGR_PEP_ID=MMETSP0698-20121128/8655_1 /TAXON_ID=265572 /ORGANISM="Extubocellulus spinifer, Strain CCMP396" /LENGTH=545 /DNA_ID=CAMNT_0020266155 /DNA_START=24 /DNA_END=1661 /DNA_ORIENTATION=+
MSSRPKDAEGATTPVYAAGASAAAAEAAKGAAASAATPTAPAAQGAGGGAVTVTQAHPAATAAALAATATAASGSTSTSTSSAKAKAKAKTAASTGAASLPTYPENAFAIWKRQQREGGSHFANIPPTSLPPRNPGKKRGPKKRGRPKGSTDTKPRKKMPPKELKWKSDMDKRRFTGAKHAVDLKVKGVERAEADVGKLEEEIRRAQARLEGAKKKIGRAKEAVRTTTIRHADDLLLEPTEWNRQYTRMLTFADDEGNVGHLAGGKIESMTGEEQKVYRSVYKWQSTQRTAKKKGTLEPYQEVLLDRIGFRWVVPGGPVQGPEGKWYKHYTALKEFKNTHGHLNVPREYPPHPKLKFWLKTQISVRRKKVAGKPEGKYLSDERERLLGELGVNWGAKRVTIPWESRFTELLQYRKDNGHCNIPWRWIGNRPLAAWVNAQRKKYMDMQRGKTSNLTQDQIRRLEEIGFRWNTGGTGRYSREPDDADQSSDSEASAEEQQGRDSLAQQHDQSMEEAQALLVEMSQSEAAGRASNIPGLGHIGANDFV